MSASVRQPAAVDKKLHMLETMCEEKEQEIAGLQAQLLENVTYCLLQLTAPCLPLIRGGSIIILSCDDTCSACGVIFSRRIQGTF